MMMAEQVRMTECELIGLDFGIIMILGSGVDFVVVEIMMILSSYDC